jgi:N6-L-threonylcarbamoyladenine synthase
MVLLGIETSCDETSAAILEKQDHRLSLKSNIIASSLPIHTKTGGIIPENAAREQVKYILPVIQEALNKAKLSIDDIDAIALTSGPGLIGSLLVGVETAKTMSFVLDKPIVPINHMVGHIYANWIDYPDIELPALAMVVSGGHTDLVVIKKHGDIKLLGGTRDDAAGEAFDKIARLLGQPYPGGPFIQEQAKKGNPKRFQFPRPLIGSHDYQFSFSGLKTAVLREVQKLKQDNKELDQQTIADIALATQNAVVSVLVKKALKAAKEHNVKSILISGGVAANQHLREQLEQVTQKELPEVNVYFPSTKLCTDNGAMIAAAAAYNFKPVPWQDITADPELYFES